MDENKCDHEWDQLDSTDDYTLDVCMYCGIMKLHNRRTSETKIEESSPNPPEELTTEADT